MQKKTGQNKTHSLQRRAFLSDVVRSAAVLSSIPAWASLSGCDRKLLQQDLIKQQPWDTFAAVQQQLFPADGNGPSAMDINAALYLKFVTEAPDTEPDDRKMIMDGVVLLNKLAFTQAQKTFTQLNDEQQNSLLKQIANSRAGERWLSKILLYIMEALLTDPVYGGNPKGIGWQWLEHQAGFPLPPKDKRYTELL